MKRMLFSLLAAGLAGEAVVMAAVKPDVLVIFTDQWNPRYVSWDNPQVVTPNLDRLAREGKVFDACYTASPICVPARISVVTGLYPHNQGHAVWGNPNNFHLPAEAAPMFRDIHRAGYTTAQIGKLHWYTGGNWKDDYPDLEAYHRAMGLDVVQSISGPTDSDLGKDLYSEHLRAKGLLGAVSGDLRQRYLKNEYEPRPSVAPPEDYHDIFVAGLAADFIRQQPKDKPLCLVASFHSPHPPLDAPAKYANLFDPAKLTLPANVPERFTYDGREIGPTELRAMLANYLGKMALVDDAVGTVIAAMKERGAWDNALVIFMADHGEMMGAHGRMSKGRFYEESARVPLVMRWPGRIPPGRTTALVQLFDVYPTIVEAIGGEVTPGRFARSLLPVATGKTKSMREVVLSEIGRQPPLSIMARNARYKWWMEQNEEYLFDLEQDPLEMNNLAKEPNHQDALSQMRGLALTELRATQVNLAEGSKSKVQRLREAAETSGKATRPQ